MRLPWAPAAIVVLLVAAPVAEAATRHVAPGGSTTSPGCSAADPCELRHAIEDVAEPEDEVVVSPGAYVTGQIRVDVPLEIHGVEGQARPVVTGSDPLFCPVHFLGPFFGAPGAAGTARGAPR